FRAAGFENAIEVREQPDEADWDANDLRYNVVRWTSSPDPYFSGYGPSFSHPRTGEIIGADVLIEFAYVANRLALDKLFDTGGLPEAGPPPGATRLHLHRHRSAAEHLRMSTLFGVAAMEATAAVPALRSRLVEESLFHLVLHEIGHTLGLTHNMRASAYRDLSAGDGEGHLSASVMDYASVNLAAPGQSQGRFFDTTPGPYDEWAIVFGYAPEPADPVAAAVQRAALLNRSTEPGLAYGNDADDMRWPGKGVDPRVMVGDMSSDAIGFAERRLRLVDATMAGLLERYDEPGASWQKLHDAYLILTAEKANAAAVISRYVGGLYVDRAAQGQPGAAEPFAPTPLAEQKRAMDLLKRELFAPGAFDTPEILLR
ncbi:MAG: zinc-dependent metalloprotease, partial [Pseudomonadota bacterium]